MNSKRCSWVFISKSHLLGKSCYWSIKCHLLGSFSMYPFIFFYTIVTKKMMTYIEILVVMVCWQTIKNSLYFHCNISQGPLIMSMALKSQNLKDNFCIEGTKGIITWFMHLAWLRSQIENVRQINWCCQIMLSCF